MVVVVVPAGPPPIPFSSDAWVLPALESEEEDADSKCAASFPLDLGLAF